MNGPLKNMTPETMKLLLYGQDIPTMNPNKSHNSSATIYKDPWDGYTLEQKLDLLATYLRNEQYAGKRATELEREAEKAREDYKAEKARRVKLELNVSSILASRGHVERNPKFY